MKSYSEIVDLLPTQGLLGRKKYKTSVVLVPFITVGSDEYILLQVRAEGIRQPGEISFPGGMQEDQDTSDAATAVRETCEELGVNAVDIEIGGQFDTMVNPLGLIVNVIIGRLRISSLDQLNLNKSEVQDVFLVPVKWFVETQPKVYKLRMRIFSKEQDESGNQLVHFPAEELQLPKKYWNSWGGSHHDVYVYQYEDKVIWGITAEILYELFN